MQTDQQDKSSKLHTVATLIFIIFRTIGANIVPIMSLLTAIMLLAAYGLESIVKELLLLAKPDMKENLICNSYYVESQEGTHLVAAKAKSNWMTDLDDQICMLSDGWQLNDISGHPFFTKPKPDPKINPTE